MFLKPTFAHGPNIHAKKIHNVILTLCIYRDFHAFSNINKPERPAIEELILNNRKTKRKKKQTIDVYLIVCTTTTKTLLKDYFKHLLL